MRDYSKIHGLGQKWVKSGSEVGQKWFTDPVDTLLHKTNGFGAGGIDSRRMFWVKSGSKVGHRPSFDPFVAQTIGPRVG